MSEWSFEVAALPSATFCATRSRCSVEEVPRRAEEAFRELRHFVLKHQIEDGDRFREGAQVVRLGKRLSAAGDELLDAEFAVASSGAPRGYGGIFGVRYPSTDAVVVDVRHSDVALAWVALVAWALERGLRPRGGVVEAVPYYLRMDSPVRLWLPVRQPPIVG